MSRPRTARAPVIGVTADLFEPSRNGDASTREATLSVPRRYCQALEAAGGVPVVLSPTDNEAAARRLLERLDGLLVSGGNFDIDPVYYGEKPLPGLGALQPLRTAFELALIRLALKWNLPLLGICGGAQALNIALGGSLYQDIATQVAGALTHQRSARDPSPAHEIHVSPGSMLHRMLRRRTLLVNTRHHQAVKQLGRGLVSSAVATDGLVEAIESTAHSFAIGLQWHPEALSANDPLQRRIFSAFVSACRGGARGQILFADGTASKSGPRR